MNMAATSWNDHSMEERLWVKSVAVDDLELLFRNPVYFVQHVAGKKLGNLQMNPIVAIDVKYPCGSNQQDGEPDGFVLVEGIADTNTINVRVLDMKPVSADEREKIQIPSFDPEHPVHVLLKPQEGVAIAHFHFDGDSEFRAKNAFWTARYPITHFQRIQDRINDLLLGGQGGATVRVTDEYNHEFKVSSVIIEPKTPCMYMAHFDTATTGIGGCNCALGTYTNTGGTYTVCLDTVCCSAYAHVPP